MTTPTRKDIVEAFAREFPGCPLGHAEHAFLSFLVAAREQGVGYGWMRQAIGIAWKCEDPLGYLDDERIIGLWSNRT